MASISAMYFHLMLQVGGMSYISKLFHTGEDEDGLLPSCNRIGICEIIGAIA